MKKTYAFRVDGGSNLGLGHLMRCLAIAEDLKKSKISSIFILKYFDAKVKALIKDAGFVVETLKRGDQAQETLKILVKYGIRVTIIDFSHRETMIEPKKTVKYINALRAAGQFLILFDGLTDDCLSLKVALPADIVVIPYFGAGAQKYKRFSGTKFLLGPSYFVFRKEFITQWRKKVLDSRTVRRILVTMGGSDPDGLTLSVVKALGRLLAFRYDVKVVVGKNFSIDLKKQLKKYSAEVTLLDAMQSMASLMAWADVVICGGLTKYEALFLGKIVVTLTKGQSRLFNIQGQGKLDDQGIKRIVRTIPRGILS